MTTAHGWEPANIRYQIGTLITERFYRMTPEDQSRILQLLQPARPMPLSEWVEWSEWMSDLMTFASRDPDDHSQSERHPAEFDIETRQAVLCEFED